MKKTVKLSKNEMVFIAYVMSHIGGNSITTPRKYANSILDKLSDIGIDYPHSTLFENDTNTGLYFGENIGTFDAWVKENIK